MPKATGVHRDSGQCLCVDCSTSSRVLLSVVGDCCPLLIPSIAAVTQSSIALSSYCRQNVCMIISCIAVFLHSYKPLLIFHVTVFYFAYV